MKYLFLSLFFAGWGLVSAAQTQVKKLPPDKAPTKVDRLPDDKSPTRVDRLPDDKSPTKVDRLPDDRPKTQVDRLPTEALTNIPRLDAEPDLNDLLDVDFPVEQRPRTPNAGAQAQEQPNLIGNFRFDRKISYLMRTLEGDFQSYFYFDTRTGTSLKDHQALQRMADEKFPGEMNQIFTSTGAFYQYMKTRETGAVAVKMETPANEGYLLLDLTSKSESNDFFKNFKSTGKTPPGFAQGNAANKIPRSVEYQGMVDGQKVYIYLADPRDVWLDTRLTYTLTGYSGLGYIASPSKRTYMIVGIVFAEGSIWMTQNEKVNHSFSTAGYKPMGSLMQGIENKTAGMHKFAQSSNALDLPRTDLSGMPTHTQMFDMTIQGLEEGLLSLDKQIREAESNKNTAVANRLRCDRQCQAKLLSHYKSLKQEYEAIWKQYSRNEEKRDEMIDNLMERKSKMLLANPCNCN